MKHDKFSLTTDCVENLWKRDLYLVIIFLKILPVFIVIVYMKKIDFLFFLIIKFIKQKP